MKSAYYAVLCILMHIPPYKTFKFRKVQDHCPSFADCGHIFILNCVGPFRATSIIWTKEYTVNLVIFAMFYYSRILRGGQVREFRNLAKIIIIIALKKNENSKLREKSPNQKFAKI